MVPPELLVSGVYLVSLLTSRSLEISCGDCEHRLFKNAGAAAAKCPHPKCMKFLTKATLSLKSLEEQEYEKEIRVREDLEKVCVQ